MKQIFYFLCFLMLSLFAQGQNFQAIEMLDGAGAQGDVFSGSFLTRNAVAPELLSISFDSSGSLPFGRFPDITATAFAHASTDPITVSGYTDADTRRIAVDYDNDGLTDIISVGSSGISVRKNISIGDGSNCVFSIMNLGAPLKDGFIVQLSDTMFYISAVINTVVNVNYILTYDVDTDSFSVLGANDPLPAGGDPLGRGQDRVLATAFHEVIAADMNNDGHNDLLIAGETDLPSPDNLIFYVYLYDNGSYVLSYQSPLGFFGPDMEVIDLDNDGFLDVMISDGQRGSHVHMNTTGSGVFGFIDTEVAIQMGVNGAFAEIHYQDENGQQQSLILRTGLYPQFIPQGRIPEFAEFYTHNSGANFQQIPNTLSVNFLANPVEFTTDIGILPITNQSSITVLDFNNDGLEDFIISGYFGASLQEVNQNKVVLYLQVETTLLYSDIDNDGIADSLQDPITVNQGETRDGYVHIPESNLQGYVVDSCPNIANPNQADINANNIGDACEVLVSFYPDTDGDNIADNSTGVVFGLSNIAIDGFIEIPVLPSNYIFDSCPGVINSGNDSDNDGIDDVCDNDGDNDGVIDSLDMCRETPIGVIVDARGCPVQNTSLSFDVSVTDAVCPGSSGLVLIENTDTSLNLTYRIEVRSDVFAANSRFIEERRDLQTGQSFVLGQDYPAGIYFVSVFIGANSAESLPFEFTVGEAVSAENLSLKVLDSGSQLRIENPGLSGLFLRVGEKETAIDPFGGELVVDLDSDKEVSITGTSDCQGKTILSTGKSAIKVYPTLVSATTPKITIENYTGTVSIYSVTGQLLWNGPYDQVSSLDMSMGLNLLFFDGRSSKETIKIIKR